MKDRVDFNGYYTMSHENRKKHYGENYSTWCINHTYQPVEIDGSVYMVDTFWGKSSGNRKMIKLNDENLGLFDFAVSSTTHKIIKQSDQRRYGWENVTSVKVGGSGSDEVCYFVPRELKMKPENVIEEIDEKIESLNKSLQQLLDLKREIAETDNVPKYLWIDYIIN